LTTKDIKTGVEEKISDSHTQIAAVCENYIYFYKYENVEGSDSRFKQCGIYRIGKNGEDEKLVLDYTTYPIH
jgi:hypothetical protein